MAQTTISAPQQQVAMPASDLRQLVGSLVATEGVRTPTDLVVSQRGAGANMSVDIAPGSALITDDHVGGGGVYGYTLSATTNLAVPTADPTNPRVDRVVIRVRDQALGDAANDAGPVVVTGTPTAGATLVNGNGIAALPGSSVQLANILVPAASSSVTTANIDNRGAGRFGPAGGTLTVLFDTTITSVTGAVASVDILNIPASYAHLVLELNARGDSAATSINVGLRANNDTAANYYWQRLRGNAATATASESLAQTSLQVGFLPAATATAGLGGGITIKIPAYSTNTGSLSKGIKCSSSCPTGTATGTIFLDETAGFWNSGAVINRITLTPNAGNFVVGSRFTLYGEGA